MNTKKFLFFLFPVLMSVNLFSQSPLDKKIKIDLNIIGLHDNEKYYLNSINKAGVDSAFVKEEKLSFSYTGEPIAFIISSKPDNGSDGSNKILAMFISGEKDIAITGHVDSLGNIRISGSEIYNEIMSFDKEVIRPMEIALNAIPFFEIAKRDSLNSLIIGSNTTFIEEHSGKYSGLLVLYQQIVNKAYNEEEAMKLLTLFENKYKHSYYLKTCFELLSNAKHLEIGKEAPDFSCQGLEDKIIKLSDYRGKYVLLEFWSSWCGPCISEMPFLVKAYNKYKNERFEIIGISLDTNQETWKKTIKDKSLTWPQITDLKGQQNEIAMLYCINAVPKSFLINPEGIIIEKDLRDDQLMKKLDVIFEK